MSQANPTPDQGLIKKLNELEEFPFEVALAGMKKGELWEVAGLAKPFSKNSSNSGVSVINGNLVRFRLRQRSNQAIELLENISYFSTWSMFQTWIKLQDAGFPLPRKMSQEENNDD